MCIIAAIPAKKQITKDILNRCWNNNPHGGGFLYTDGNTLLVHKEMNSFEKFYRAFTDAKKRFPESSFIVHFRISTHGKINEENCHPFLVNDKLGFAHNGVIHNSPYSVDYSDTHQFNTHILQKLPENFINKSVYQSLIEAYIGTGSKLAFLSADNVIALVNEKAGVWDGGIWYSNRGYANWNYFDRGGVQVSSVNSFTASVSGSKRNEYTIPENLSGKALKRAKKRAKKGQEVSALKLDYALENRLKNDIKMEQDVIEACCLPSKAVPKCEVCDITLNTLSERLNNTCNKCFNDSEYVWF
jgi:glutamine amidotransferase